MFKPKKAEVPKIPPFEELKKSLPEELQEEFQKLGEDIEKIASIKGGAMDGREVEDEFLSDKEKKVFSRYGELQKIAMDKLQSK